MRTVSSPPLVPEPEWQQSRITVCMIELSEKRTPKMILEAHNIVAFLLRDLIEEGIE